MQPVAVERWHGVVKARDTALLGELIADGAVFQSPAVHAPQEGKALTMKYLESALAVLGNPSFRYLNEWVGPTSAVLEFETEVDGLVINGVDIIEWDDAGCITRFKVMVRPVKALNRLIELMGAELRRRAG